MVMRTTYPDGVPCWIDVVQPDLESTMAFYGGLFGWTFERRTPPQAPQQYAYARLDGGLVAGVGGGGSQGWTAYVRVDDAEAAARRAVAAGGRVVAEPADVGPPGSPTGRSVQVADPTGAVLGAWQPATLQGAEVVNAAGSWNFNSLEVADPSAVAPFYAEVFGWVLDELPMDGPPAWMWRVPGYGEHLAALDPAYRDNQASAPAGFADAVALAGFPTDGAGPGWSTTFAVADVEEALERATGLGAVALGGVVASAYDRSVTIRDPQGAISTLSQYVPPA